MLPRSDDHVVWRADEPRTIAGDWAYLAEAVQAFGYHYVRAIRSIYRALRGN